MFKVELTRINNVMSHLLSHSTQFLGSMGKVGWSVGKAGRRLLSCKLSWESFYMVKKEVTCFGDCDCSMEWE
jgi:hypothetical protein